MILRCTYPKNDNFMNYGGRGITVCERWRKFENFFADMGFPPEGTTLDRIDGNKGYDKSNCRWATSFEQNSNRRDNKWYEFNGESLLLTEWSKRLGIKIETLRSRLLTYGWSVEKTLTTPLRPRCNNRILTLNGESGTLASWARRLGMNWIGLARRLERGWPIEKALTQPSRRPRRVQ